MLQEIIQAIRSNPVLLGAASMYGLGIVTWLAKGVPAAIWRLLKKELFTTIALNTRNNQYTTVVIYLSRTKRNKWARNHALSGSEITFGYGLTWFFHKRRLFLVDRQLDTKTAGNGDSYRETMIISMLGRSTKMIQDLIEEAAIFFNKPNNKTRIVRYRNGWQVMGEIEKRPLSSIFIEAAVQKTMLDNIELFLGSADWYIKRGLPYRLGLLLTGPPGTGKSSLIATLAGVFNKDVYLLSLKTISDYELEEAISTVPQGGFLVIEDIDRLFEEKNREVNLTETGPSLAGLLNTIDGIGAGQGRILIATANKPELLDEALIRPGRFDFKVELGYVTPPVLREAFATYYPGAQNPIGKPRTHLTGAEMQIAFLENRNNPEEFLRVTTTC
jgi:mitochondrial chaperone BCS1